ncbi:MAG: transporter substrate-binding domain-containing protein, partial [Burkholderiales bacterium]
IALVAMLYSTYAIWASGLQAVMGGVLVMAIGYIIWGFIAPRFAGGAGATARAPAAVKAMIAATIFAFGAALLAPRPAEAQTLDAVKSAGKIRFGYRADARPFSYKDESGNAAGYSVALCQKIADALKTELKLPQLAVEWVPLTPEGRFADVAQGKIDLSCGADSDTLARRAQVSFSIPVYPGGIGALLRADAPSGLVDILERRPPSRPLWRGSPALVLQEQTFSVVANTTSATWLAERLDTFQLTAKVVPVDSYAAGIEGLLAGRSSVFFGDRAILLDAATRSPSAGDLTLLERHFTYEPIGLALRRGDEDFRLAVDRSLSRLFRSEEIGPLYAKWFGKPDRDARDFFRMTALPE